MPEPEIINDTAKALRDWLTEVLDQWPDGLVALHDDGAGLYVFRNADAVSQFREARFGLDKH